MRTWFCFVSAVLLGLFYMLLHGPGSTQLPGQAAGNMANRNYEFPESKGLSASPGLPQRDFK
jgi:hypothetical protein